MFVASNQFARRLVELGAEGEAEMILRIVAVLIALLVSSAAQSRYLTFQTWSAASETFRVAYIAGAYDSLVIFAEGEQEERISAHYERCIGAAKMQNGQLAANVLNFAKDKPELHTGSVQGALLQYLIAACGVLPTK
jgi:hypothetical protein